MKTIIFLLSFFCLASAGYAQKQLLSYEDMKYLIENNLQKADTFLVSKGYKIEKISKKNNTRKYFANLQGGTKSNLELRADGKRIYLEIDTDDIAQYNMIHNSIAQFLIKNGEVADIQTYVVKDLGTIYISINDTMPYNPVRKDYDIHLVTEKNITSYN